MSEAPEPKHGHWLDWPLLAALLVFWALAEWLVLRGSLVEISDSVRSFLEASDILHGNWALSGWMEGSDNFYTLDVPLSVVCLSLFGFSLSVLLFQSLVTYGCLVAGALRLSRAPGSVWWISGALLFLFLGLLTSSSLPWLMYLDAHVATLAVILFCFPLAARLGDEDGWVPRRWAWFAYAGWSFLALAGDPFYLFVGLLPILTAAGLAAVWYGRWRALVKLSVVSLLALVAAKILLGFLAARGFRVLDLTPSLAQAIANFDTIKLNLYTYARSLWALLGAGGEDLLWLGGASAPGLAHGFLGLRLLAAAIAVGGTGKLLLKRKPAGNPEVVFLDSVLLAGVGLNSAEYIFSTMPGPLDSILTCRYLMPTVIYASILVVRRCGPGLSARWLAATPRVRVLAPTMVFAALALFGPRILQLSHGQPNAADFQLVDYLEAKGLQSGYAGYWQSNIITVLSQQKVKIAPLTFDETGRLYPAMYSKPDWYDTPSNFVVCYPDDPRYSGNFNCNVEAPAIRTFGPPQEIALIGPYRVLIWNHDLHGQLARPDDSATRKFSLDLLKLRRQTLAPAARLNTDGSISDEQNYPQSTPVILSPPLQLPPGSYRATFVLVASDVADTDFMICDAALGQGDKILTSKNIPGSQLVGRTTTATVTLTFENPGAKEVCELRVWKAGGAKLTLLALRLEKI